MMGLREYARHRGCRLNAVQTAVAAGRIQVLEGQVDSEQADADWEANTNPVGAMRERVPPPAEGPTAPAPTQARERYAAIRAEREDWERRMAQLKYEEKAGLLVSAAECAARYEKFVVLSKANLLGLPAKIKGDLPHLSTRDLARIDRLIHEALEGLANVGSA
jgi:phage terminase Nu1 subunit (DNA packaging protein)